MSAVTDRIKGPHRAKRVGRTAIVLLLLVYLILLVGLTLEATSLSPDPNAYPWRLETRMLLPQNLATDYIPESNLLHDAAGLLAVTENKEGSYELVQYDEKGNMVGYEHRIKAFDKASLLSEDLDGDGADELIAYRYNDNKTVAIAGVYSGKNRFVPVDTFHVPDQYYQEGKTLNLNMGNYPNDYLDHVGHVYIFENASGDYYRLRYISILELGDPPSHIDRVQIPFGGYSLVTVQTGAHSSDAIASGGSPCNGVYGHHISNGAYPDSMNDCQSIVMRLSSEGKIRWVRSLMDGGGQTFVTTSEKGDTVAAVFLHKAFVEGGSSAHLFRLRGGDGSVIDHRSWPCESHYTTTHRAATRRQGVVFVREDTDPARMVVLSATGSIEQEIPLPEELGTVYSVTRMALPDGHEGLAILSDRPSLAILDLETSRIMLHQPQENIRSLQVMRIGGGDIARDYLLIRKRIDAQIAGLERNPLPGWLLARYRWFLLGLLIPPALLLAGFFIFRYSRLRDRSLHEMKAYANQLHQLSTSLQNAQERERKRVARDLHDQLGQYVAILRWTVEKAEGLTRPHRQKLRHQLNALQEDIYKIINDLRPPLLDDLGLLPAIEQELEQFQQRFGIQTVFRPETDREPEDPELRLALFRAVQEGLTNVVKHANAAMVQVEYLRTDGRLELRVVDDGAPQNRPGVKASDPRIPVGILGIAERLKPFEGTVELIENRTGGMCMQVTVPSSDSCSTSGFPDS